MRSKGYSSWVYLSVCLSVKPHLTSGASLHPEINVTYATGNEGKKIRVVFSKTAPLRRFCTSCIVWLFLVGHFSLCRKKTRMRMPRLLAGGVVPRDYAVRAEGLHFSAFSSSMNQYQIWPCFTCIGGQPWYWEIYSAVQALRTMLLWDIFCEAEIHYSLLIIDHVN